MPPKKKWRGTVSDKPNNLAVIWMACKGKRIWRWTKDGKITFKMACDAVERLLQCCCTDHGSMIDDAEVAIWEVISLKFHDFCTIGYAFVYIYILWFMFKAKKQENGDWWEIGDRKGGVAAMSRLHQNCLKLLRCNQLWKWLSFSCGGLKIQLTHMFSPVW